MNTRGLVLLFLLINIQLVNATLVGSWKFDENNWNGTVGEVIDSSNNFIHGKAVNGANTSQGFIGRCGSFDGTSKYVEIPHNSALENLTSKSVFMWIKPLAEPTGSKDVYCGGYWSSPYGDLFRLGIDGILIFYLKNSVGTIVSHSVKIPINQWSMIGYAWDGTTVNFFINGQVIKTKSFSGTLSGTGANTKIGGNSGYFNGNVDEVMIYNSAVQEYEAEIMYYQGATILNLRFDEASYNGTSGEVKDSGQRELNGTSVGNANITEGLSGNSVLFDGIDSYISAPSDTNLQNFTEKSVFMWINPTALPSSTKDIYTAGYWGGTFGDLIRYSSDENVYVYLKNSQGQVAYSTSIYAPAGVWTHIGYTWDGTVACFYENGRIVDSKYFSGILACTSGNTRIGGSSGFFNGRIDEFKIFNSKISESKLADIMYDNVLNYAFDEASYSGATDEVTDCAQRGLDGTAVNGANISTDGLSGNSVLFDGSNDYISVPTDANLQNFVRKSVFMWVKPSAVPSSTKDIYAAGYWGGTFGDLIRYSSDENVYVYLKNSLGQTVSSTMISAPADAWTHIGYTWDGTVACFYENGKIVDSQDFSGILACTSENARIGGKSGFFNGKIDQFHVFRNSLVGSAVKTIYENERRIAPSPIVLEPLCHEEILYDWNPDFERNVVSFDSHNRAYIRSRENNQQVTSFVQTYTNGNNVNYDFMQAIRNAYPSCSSTVIGGGTSVIPAHVTFDKDDCAYTVVKINTSSGTKGILLFSPDKCQTWQVYELPVPDHGTSPVTTYWSVEKRTGYNLGAGNVPCIAVLNQYNALSEQAKNPDGTPAEFGYRHTLDILTPVKNTNNTLSLGTLHAVSNNCFGISMHSGGTGFASTQTDPQDGHVKTNIIWGELTTTPENGSPVYINTFDHTTGAMVGDKVFLVNSKPANDIHCSPQICQDSDGYLHVVTGSHHLESLESFDSEKIYYLKSSFPKNINSWSIPLAAWDYGYNGYGIHTYVSLVCDINDTLHLVTRQTRNDMYSSEVMFMLCYSRKIKNGTWEKSRPLVVPPYGAYSVYYHQLSTDYNGNLYLSYCYWGITPSGDYGGLLAASAMTTYRSLLCSHDGGATWDLVHGGDFEKEENP